MLELEPSGIEIWLNSQQRGRLSSNRWPFGLFDRELHRAKASDEAARDTTIPAHTLATVAWNMSNPNGDWLTVTSMD